MNTARISNDVTLNLMKQCNIWTNLGLKKLKKIPSTHNEQLLQSHRLSEKYLLIIKQIKTNYKYENYSSLCRDRVCIVAGSKSLILEVYNHHHVLVNFVPFRHLSLSIILDNSTRLGGDRQLGTNITRPI